MHWFTSIAQGLSSLFHRQRTERELDEELQGFLDASVAHKRHLGMARDEARRAARVELGSSNSVKHQVWSSRWESTVEGILQDLRVSVRTLLKSPGFTAVALLSLALGIGGNTAIFTLINQVLLRNLPVRDPEQLVAFSNSEYGGIAGGIDLGAFGGYFPWDFARQMQANPGPFQGIAAYGSFSGQVSVRPLGTGGAANPNSPALLAPANLVSGNYFSVLGAQPLLGRVILPADDAIPGSGAVAVLSYHFWQQSLSADPHIVGRSICTSCSYSGALAKQRQFTRRNSRSARTGSTSKSAMASTSAKVLTSPPIANWRSAASTSLSFPLRMAFPSSAASTATRCRSS